MKKTLLLISLIINILCYSQKINLTNTSNYIQSNKLDQAKLEIDPAIHHITTMEKAKTWMYYGDVYFRIFTSKEEKFKNLDKNPGIKALNGYLKAMSIDTKKINTSHIERNIKLLQDLLLNAGVKDFNDKNYAAAVEKFEASNKAANYFNLVDNLAVYNTALSYERLKNYDRAIDYYKESLSINYKAETSCSAIVHILKQQGKNSEAYEFVKQCRVQFPKSQSFLITELNHYLSIGDSKSALNLLEKGIENDPTNAILHYTNGTLLSQLNQIYKAKQSYSTAIKLNPNYFDAFYNLGALYYNLGADKMNSAREIDDDSAYNKAIEEAISTLKKAILPLEKAHMLKPADINTMNSLRQLYAQSGQDEKYSEMTKKLNNH